MATFVAAAGLAATGAAVTSATTTAEAALAAAIGIAIVGTASMMEATTANATSRVVTVEEAETALMEREREREDAVARVRFLRLELERLTVAARNARSRLRDAQAVYDAVEEERNAAAAELGRRTFAVDSAIQASTEARVVLQTARDAARTTEEASETATVAPSPVAIPNIPLPLPPVPQTLAELLGDVLEKFHKAAEDGRVREDVYLDTANMLGPIVRASPAHRPGLLRRLEEQMVEYTASEKMPFALYFEVINLLAHCRS